MSDNVEKISKIKITKKMTKVELKIIKKKTCKKIYL